MALDLAPIFARLARGARLFHDAPAERRAAVAVAAARTVAAVATDWADAAVAVKRGGGAARAEELATGPLATVRLLLTTASAWRDIARHGVPRLPRPPRLAHAGRGGSNETSRVAIDLLPARGLRDGVIFQGHQATVRCGNPGGIEAFMRSWAREVADRPRNGGVAVVLGAGNVTGLSVADAVCQIFEHGRAALVKLHPLHEPLVDVFTRGLAPLVEADLLAFVVGDAAVARAAVAAPAATHVHLTGGRIAFDALVATTSKPLTCELGNVTPWFVVPGRYTAAQLRFQADTIAASIAHNTSFNCIATKLVVTCRSWDQRGDFLALVQRRLASLPGRPAWYPGSPAVWREAAGREPPADGTLPCVFRTGLDRRGDAALFAREWFVPIAGELPIDAADVEDFCVRASALARDLPGSLAASVTAPATLSTRDAERVEGLLEHLPFGIVALNGWSALAYTIGCVPWGGYPGGTLADPRSGIGFVHDPLLLPLVHNSIVRCPLATPLTPPWVPWHGHGAALAEGLIDMYGALASGRTGLWRLARMLPAVLGG